MKVIPGWPRGPGPEPMNTGPSTTMHRPMCMGVRARRLRLRPGMTDRLAFSQVLLRAAAHRGRMAGQCEALPGIGQRCAVDLQDREIRVDEIADIEIAAVGAEGAAFGKCSDIDLACIGDLLAVDLERGDRTCRVIERGTLHVRAARLDGNREITLWADCETLGRVPDGYMVDDPRRVRFEVDHADRVDTTV